MALSKYTLKEKFRMAILQEIPIGDRTQDQKDSAERVAKKMSDAVDLFVRSATVVSTGTAGGGAAAVTSTTIT